MHTSKPELRRWELWKRAANCCVNVMLPSPTCPTPVSSRTDMATWSEAVLLARLNQGVSEISPAQEKSSAERVGGWHDGASSALQLTQRFEISGRECAECKGLITRRLPKCFTAITPDPAASPAPASGWASAVKLAPVTGSTGRFAEAARGTPPPQPPLSLCPRILLRVRGCL
ncbi:hypothetical protein UY3_01829 [Chelonia mydas]|uniref:Uncharacterized protein n=1 Tax=Chelonia mydas TaxID=8469 RepID=M7CJ35_CHEMY|nr:hypothetical protein UY3_01829 [Chelonia mydas]